MAQINETATPGSELPLTAILRATGGTMPYFYEIVWDTVPAPDITFVITDNNSVRFTVGETVGNGVYAGVLRGTVDDSEARTQFADLPITITVLEPPLANNSYMIFGEDWDANAPATLRIAGDLSGTTLTLVNPPTEPWADNSYFGNIRYSKTADRWITGGLSAIYSNGFQDLTFRYSHSSDDGTSWTTESLFLPNFGTSAAIYPIIQDPQDDLTYALARQNGFEGFGGWITTDAGLTTGPSINVDNLNLSVFYVTSGDWGAEDVLCITGDSSTLGIIRAPDLNNIRQIAMEGQLSGAQAVATNGEGRWIVDVTGIDAWVSETNADGFYRIPSGLERLNEGSSTAKTFSFANEDANIRSARFNHTGQFLYTVSSAGVVYEYTQGGFSTLGDISFSTYTGDSSSVAAQEPSPRDIFVNTFSPTGVFVIGDNAAVYRYTGLVGALTFNSTFSVAAQEAAPKCFTIYNIPGDGFTFGRRLYVLGDNLVIYQYNLGTAWNITTASYSGFSFSVAGQVTTPVSIDMFFSTTATTLILVGDTSGQVYSYEFIGDDVSRAVYIGNTLNTGATESAPVSIRYSGDQGWLHTAGTTTGSIHEYQLPGQIPPGVGGSVLSRYRYLGSTIVLSGDWTNHIRVSTDHGLNWSAYDIDPDIQIQDFDWDDVDNAWVFVGMDYRTATNSVWIGKTTDFQTFEELSVPQNQSLDSIISFGTRRTSTALVTLPAPPPDATYTNDVLRVNFEAGDFVNLAQDPVSNWTASGTVPPITFDQATKTAHSTKNGTYSGRVNGNDTGTQVNTNSYWLSDANTDYQFALNESFTIQFWCSTSRFCLTSQRQIILGTANTIAPVDGWWAVTGHRTASGGSGFFGTLQFDMYSGGQHRTMSTIDGLVDAIAYQHVAIVRKGGEWLRFYVGGHLVNESTDPVWQIATTAYDQLAFGGGSLHGTFTTRNWEGEIDDIRITKGLVLYGDGGPADLGYSRIKPPPRILD